MAKHTFGGSNLSKKRWQIVGILLVTSQLWQVGRISTGDQHLMFGRVWVAIDVHKEGRRHEVRRQLVLFVQYVVVRVTNDRPVVGNYYYRYHSPVHTLILYYMHGVGPILGYTLLNKMQF